MNQVAVEVRATDPILLKGATALLSSRPDIRVAQEEEHAATIVHVQDRTDHAAIAAIKAAGGRAVVVTNDFPHHWLTDALLNGVVAVLPRHSVTAEDLADAVLSTRTVMLPPDLQNTLVDQVRKLNHDVLAPMGMTVSGITVREREMLTLVADGLNTAAIAERLSYSERTVKSALYAMMNRLGLTNRAHAVAYALRSGAI